VVKVALRVIQEIGSDGWASLFQSLKMGVFEKRWIFQPVPKRTIQSEMREPTKREG
jgi:hypothetical protein